MKYKRIRNTEQYNQYCDIYEQLMFNWAEKNADELDLLELLIDDFDNRTIEVIGEKEDMKPVEILEYLMKENSLTKAALARQLDVSRQLVTEILNYKRNISKKMISKLCERFKMKPIAFSREYKLIEIQKEKLVTA